MKSIEISQVTALVPLIPPGNSEPVILTRDGQALAAIVPLDQQDLESLLLSINPQFQAILDRSQKRLDAEGGLSSLEVRNRLGMQPSSD